MASGEMENLKSTNSQIWSAETELQFLGAKLFLIGWSFQGQGQAQQSNLTAPVVACQPLLSKKLILHEVLGTATRYIHAYSEIGMSKPLQRSYQSPNLAGPKSSLNDGNPPQIYFPKHYFFTLYYAALSLYRFLESLPHSSISDQDLARNHIRLAHTVLSHCAINDVEGEWSRLAQNVELVGQFSNSGRRLPPEGQIKSRQGAGLFYDGMLKLAVLKAEKGVVSYSSDLLQHGPGDRVDVGEEEISKLPEISQASSSSVAASGQDQQCVPLEWDDAFWGWDLSMMDTNNLQLDWTALDQWQP